MRAAHIEPTIAVTTIAAVLGFAFGLNAFRLLLATAAVLAGQLVIGWSNDLIDVGRDSAVQRGDKPLVTGDLTPQTVAVALACSTVAAVGLSATLGWRSAMTHLVLLVGSGIAYNLGLKSTAFSWLPYTVAFGSLPAVLSLADSPPALPAPWIIAASAALGTAAHFLNTLPDLADDAATGVRGLPHRLGARWSKVSATALLFAATVITVLGESGSPQGWAWLALLGACALAFGVLAGHGRLPFRCAIAAAALNVALLVTMVRL